MIECEECGKIMGIFEGYRHLTMGRKHSLCSNCFDQVNESVNKWREFFLQNNFNNNMSKNNIEMNWKNVVLQLNKRRNILEDVRAEADILFNKLR